jgi:hypothetical protein
MTHGLFPMTFGAMQKLTHKLKAVSDVALEYRSFTREDFARMRTLVR